MHPFTLLALLIGAAFLVVVWIVRWRTGFRLTNRQSAWAFGIITLCLVGTDAWYATRTGGHALTYALLGLAAAIVVGAAVARRADKITDRQTVWAMLVALWVIIATQWLGIFNVK
jgi:hypothetical protein